MGQVAAPSILPPMPRIMDPLVDVPQTTMVPENPAAMEWGPRASYGAGTTQTERKVGEETSSGAGYLIAGLVRSELYSANITLLVNYVDDLSTTLYKVSGSTSIGKTLALGAAQDSFDRDSDRGSGGVNSTGLGLSLNLGDLLFLGFAQQQDSLSEKPSYAMGGSDISASRAVRKFGAALVLGSREKELLLHAEVYRMDRDEYKAEGSGFGGGEFSAGVLELKAGAFVFGYTGFTVGKTSSGATTEGFFGDIGWEGGEFLKTYFHIENTTTTFSDGTEVITSSQALIAGFVF